MSKKRNHNGPSSEERRRTLEDDVRAFLKSGKKIEQIPTGVSGQDQLGRGKHITLGRPKQAPAVKKA